MAVFILAAALQIGLITRAAIADALLNLFVTMTMFAIYEYSLAPRNKHAMIAYVGMALGFMTKGPIAVAIPVMVSLCYFLCRKEMKAWLKIMFHPAGWAIFLVIAVPWYVVLIQKYGWHFIREIFLVHNLGRFQSPMEGHSGSLFYYVPIALIGLMPFTTLLIRAASQLRLPLQKPLDLFLWLWFGFVFGFFSLAGTKLHHYLVYGYIPLIIFMARVADQNQLKRPWLLVLPALLFLVLLFFLPDLAGWMLPKSDDPFAKIVIAEAVPSFGAGYRLAVGLALAVIATAAVIPKCTTPIRSIWMGAVFLILINGQVLPHIADILQGPVKSAAITARKEKMDVVMWRMNYPSFHVYYGKPAIRKKPEPGDIVITKADKLGDIESHSVIFQKYGIVLTKLVKL